MIQKFITTLIATLLITSIVAPVAGVAAAQNGAGMAGVPSENVGPPDHANGNGPGGGQGGPPDHVGGPPSHVPTTASAWSAKASEHAGALEVTIGSVDSQIALVFTDSQNHDGRRVAVDASTLADAVGEKPELAYITHENGTQYEVPITYESGDAILEIDRFSSNTVTFSGEISITGADATSGSQYQYDVANLDAVGDYSINVTGSTASAWNNVSAAGVGLSSSQSISPDGNMAPVGPGANGDPVIEVTANAGTDVYNPVDDEGDGATDGSTYFVGDTGSDVAISSEVQVQPTKTGRLSQVEVNTNPVSGSDYGASVDVYLVQEGTDSTYGEGTQIATWDPDWTSGYQTISIDSPPTVEQGTTYTLEFVTTSSDGDGSGDFINIVRDDSASAEWMTNNAFGGSSVQSYGDTRLSIETSVEGLSVTEDGSSNSVSFGTMQGGETVSKELPVSTSTTSLSWSGSGGGTIDYTLKLRERTQTVDPTVEVNGNTVSHSGALADGETVSLSTDTAWVREGTNQVNISAADPGGTAPTPQLGLEYRHTIEDKKSVDYSGSTWSETYNISKTYASDRTGAQLMIPFASDRVIGIRSVEKRVGGGSWQTVGESERTLIGSEITVDLGDVSAGETVEVRATGTKVRVDGGEIRVVEPTMLGEELDTKIALEQLGPDTEIYVNGTGRSDELHYTHSESWSNPQAYARFRTDGSQALRFPNAAESDQARISTLDMDVAPSNGHADIRLVDAGDEPEFQVRNSTDTDQIAFTYRATSSGHTYQLFSLDSELERDTAEASSPVTLISPGVPETLAIYDLGQTSGSGDPPIGPTSSGTAFGQNAAFIIGAAVAGLIALFLVSRRFGGDTISSGTLFVVGAVVIVVVALQVLAPNILADYLGRALESAFPLLLLAGAGLGIVWLRQRGDDTSIIIQGQNK
jgi:hypothetical protein